MWAKIKVTYSGPKMLEAIIIEATFFFHLGFLSRTFTIYRTTTGEEGGYLIETNFFGQIIYGEVILNGRTTDQIMPMWGRSFINEKCIFQ